MIKIAFLAPSCYGKSTAINILRNNYHLKNIKIAEPLYELQKVFYSKIGAEIGERQDGELLQFYGIKIRNEKPAYLITEFLRKVNSTLQNYQLITNDDCRPNDYKFLKNNGFVFIKINGYPRIRDDYTIANCKSSLEWQENIPYDYEVNNFGTMADYIYNLNACVKKIIKGNSV